MFGHAIYRLIRRRRPVPKVLGKRDGLAIPNSDEKANRLVESGSPDEVWARDREANYFIESDDPEAFEKWVLAQQARHKARADYYAAVARALPRGEFLKICGSCGGMIGGGGD